MFKGYEGQIRASTLGSTPGRTPVESSAANGLPLLQALQCIVFLDRSSHPVYAGRYMQQTVLQTLRQDIPVKKSATSTSARGISKIDAILICFLI